ncbi:stemmadenine O-acetyltransferase-like [Tripterygium wilfordii]|uniref:stemmadenine O-acetyltransferase-like n=1 Tax=Tripterygium wilfordii TaxID=458696 RepID=UPI0018F7F3A3|nr:stemmadenine O-acetyltransferase-like [Tripterygium wilfordii]
MEIEIISKQYIKPSSPTPSHLKTYQISLLDQYGPSGYGRVLLFYSANQDYSIPNRSQILKQSLSQTLTRYYPVAGKIRDNLSIDCNDEGVLYIETRILNCCLDDYLSNLEVSSIFKLFPDAVSNVVSSGAPVAIVQENVFTCGGMALGCFPWHVIFDASTLSAFLKTWSAFARNSVEEALFPNFTASTIFPPNISFNLDSLAMASRLFEWSPSVVTRRFFFDGSVIANLKAQATRSSSLQNPTRAEVVSALLLKSFTAALLKVKLRTQIPIVMNFPVNLRRRATPQIPETCVGNLLFFATLMAKGGEEFDGLVWKMRESLSKLNGNVMKSLQGDGGWLKLVEIIGKLHDELFSDSGIVHIGLNSWCNMGLYSVDFGFGKPLWIPASGFGIKNYMFLTDTKHGDGIEAWVSLDEQVMAVLEQDNKLMSLVSIDASPLELGNPNPSLPKKIISSMSKF